jgi:hypothetical protein
VTPFPETRSGVELACGGGRSICLPVRLYMHDSFKDTAAVPVVEIYCTFAMGCPLQARESIVFWSGVADLDPKFAQESESGLRTAQSPAGSVENCAQSLTEIYRQSSLASRPAGCWLAGHASHGKSQSN